MKKATKISENNILGFVWFLFCLAAPLAHAFFGFAPSSRKAKGNTSNFTLCTANTIILSYFYRTPAHFSFKYKIF